MTAEQQALVLEAARPAIRTGHRTAAVIKAKHAICKLTGSEDDMAEAAALASNAYDAFRATRDWLFPNVDYRGRIEWPPQIKRDFIRV